MCSRRIVRNDGTFTSAAVTTVRVLRVVRVARVRARVCVLKVIKCRLIGRNWWAVQCVRCRRNVRAPKNDGQRHTQNTRTKYYIAGRGREGNRVVYIIDRTNANVKIKTKIRIIDRRLMKLLLVFFLFFFQTVMISDP